MIDFLIHFIFIAGYIVGLGAVLVIDLHGLFAQNSLYWTEATIRTHKVTKPLIWIGTSMVLVGGSWWYALQGLHTQGILHVGIMLVLILNGLFLSFVISPMLLEKEQHEKKLSLLPMSLQNKIKISFIFSVLGWWGSLILFILTLTQIG